MRVTKFILQYHQLPSEMHVINSVISGSPSAKYGAGMAHWVETFPPSPGWAGLAKTSRGWIQNPPLLPRGFHAPECQTQTGTPSPSRLQRETGASSFCWHDGHRQLHQQKSRFRQTKPVPCLVNLPLQGPAVLTEALECL